MVLPSMLTGLKSFEVQGFKVFKFSIERRNDL